MFEQSDGAQDCGSCKRGKAVSGKSAQVADGQRQQTENRAESIHRQHGAALAAKKIREAVRGVVLAGGGERNKAAPGSGNGNQRGIEDCSAKDENGHQPRRIVPARHHRPQFQGERGHQEAEKHRATITHEDFCGLEIPAQESGGGSQDRGGHGADQKLSALERENGEEQRRHRRDSGAQSVHVVQNAE